METHTPTPAERFTILREKLCRRLDAEGPRYNVARMVDLLVLQIIMYMISVFISREQQGAQQQGAQQQACRDDAGVEPGRAAAGDAGADRPAARAPDARGRAAVSAEVATADEPLVVDGMAPACERRPHERRPHERRHWPAMARTVPAMDCGSRVLDGLFAKTAFMVGSNCADFVSDS
jgi:hypothetical protein